MIQDALRTIGEAIIEDRYSNQYEPYYTASPIAGYNKEIETIAVLRFERIADRMEYRGVELREPEPTPEETAAKYGYVNSSPQTDNSVTQRCSENAPITDRYEKLVAWFDEDVLGDELLSDPDLAGVASILNDAIGSTQDEVAHDLDNAHRRVEYRAFLTLSITKDGEEMFVGDLDAYNEGMLKWASDDLRTKSTAKDTYGFTRCALCDTETECFGLGADMTNQYAVKQQWAFPELNSSKSWQNRPLCMDCITAVEVASDRFLEAQDYGVPGMRCRVIPYALPMPGGEEQLKALIKNARFTLFGTPEEDSDESDDGEDSYPQRPLSDAWETYRTAVENGDQPDALRLAFSHIYRDSSKVQGVAWIDGVSVDQVQSIQRSMEDLYENDPVFVQELLPKPYPPTERQIFSGAWLFRTLADVRGSNHRGEYVGDETPWAEYTERLLTHAPIDYSELVTVMFREIRARNRERLSNNEDYPFDGFHLAETYGFLRLAAAEGLLRDKHHNDDPITMTIDTLDGSYTSFDDGVEEFVRGHPSIDASPGRTAAFVLGVAAAQLSNWQAYRGLSQTFMQTRDIDQLTDQTLTQWQTDIWEKAKIYNQQAGRYGVPWSGVESLFHEAVLEADNSAEGWQATTEEMRYHYVLGVNVGPRISSHAQENRDRAESEIPETESGETVPAIATEGETDTEADAETASNQTEPEAHQ